MNRTFLEELSIWWAWVSEDPLNRATNILGFARQSGWLPNDSTVVMLLFQVEVLCLIPVALIDNWVLLRTCIFTMLGTLLLFVVRYWGYSKLASVAVLLYFVLPVAIVAVAI